MRVRRVILRIVLIVVVLLIAVAGWMYWQAGRIPEAYQPAELTPIERQAAAKRFVRRLMQDFNNIAQNTAPAPFQITQKELNEYLASMDEIAAIDADAQPDANGQRTSRSGEVNRRMAEVGLADPAVALHDGLVTLMIHSVEFDRILSLDVAFVFTDSGTMKVVLQGIRVGELDVPRRLVESQIDELKKKLGQRARAQAGRTRDLDEIATTATEEAERMFATLIAAIDEAPISPEFTWFLNKKRVRIEAIEIENGLATLQVRPLGRDARADE